MQSKLLLERMFMNQKKELKTFFIKIYVKN
jgi:hypothetical protein